MSSRCAAYGCGNRLGKSCRNLKITFHKFPKDPGLRLLWEQAVDRGGRQAKYSRILCSTHFTEDDLNRTGRIVRLRENTVPSIFPDRLRKDATVTARDDWQIERDPLLVNIKQEADASEVSTCGPPAFTSVYIKEEPTDLFDETLSTSDDVLLTKEVVSKGCFDTLLSTARVFVDPPPTQVLKAEPDPRGPLPTTTLGREDSLQPLRSVKWEDGDNVAATEPFATSHCIVVKPANDEAPSACSDPLLLPDNLPDPPPNPFRRQDYLSKPHACLDCAYRTDRLGNLRSHAKTHTGEKPHVCTVCSHACATATHLRRHALTHTGHRPHACPVCDKRFTCSRNVANHVRRHAGEKPFACPICSYSCSASTNLKHHMRTHSGERPHACTQCGYRASKSSHLKRHLLTHAAPARKKRAQTKSYDPALRPYACDHCEYRCAEQGYLRQHMRAHTGEKPYACSACNYRCARRGDLKSHMITHGNRLKTHVCAQCGTGFTRISGLKRHAVRKHEKVS